MMNSKRIIRIVAITIIIFVLLGLAHILAGWTANQNSTLCEAMILFSIAIGGLAALGIQYIDKKYPRH
jgi:hypothetical protein